MTQAIDYKEFLRGIFGEEWTQAWVTARDPEAPATVGWTGTQMSRWIATKTDPRDDEAVYFSTAIFAPGSKARTLSNAVEARVFVFDDVSYDGTTKHDGKALEALLGTPFWKNESSGRNFQVGYFLEKPITRESVYVALGYALGQKGLTDPGGHSMIRNVRLPMGVNGKDDPAKRNFKVRLVEWNPETHRPIDEETIEMLLGVDPGKLPDASMSGSFTADMAHPDMWLRALDSLGWVKGPGRKRGLVDIRCPFEDEHSKDDGRTSYAGGGRFLCQHSCSAKYGKSKGYEPFQKRVLEEVAETLGAPPVKVMAGWVKNVFRAEIDGGGLAGEEVSDMPEVLLGGDTGGGGDGDDYDPLSDPVVVDGFVGTESDWKKVVDRVVWIASMDRFFDVRSRAIWSPMAFRERVKSLVPMTNLGAKAANLEFFGQGGKTVSGLTYWPGQSEIVRDEDGFPLANLWRQKKIKVAVGSIGDVDVKPWLDHLTLLIGDQEVRDTVLDFFTWTLRFPGVKINWMLLLASIQGVGKDMLIDPFLWAVGSGNTAPVTMQDLEDGFNSSWIEKKLIVITEMSQAGKKPTYEKMKGVIAAPPHVVTVRKKFFPNYVIPNLSSVLAMTNHDDAAMIPHDDRRTWVVKIEDTAKQDADYYSRFGKWLDGGGREKVAAWLRDRAIVGLNFDAKACPRDILGHKEEMAYDGAGTAIQFVMDLFGPGGAFEKRRVVSMAEVLAAGAARSRAEITSDPVRLYHAKEGLRQIGAVRSGHVRVDGRGSSKVRLWVIPGRGLPTNAVPKHILRVWAEEAPKGAALPEGAADFEE